MLKRKPIKKISDKQKIKLEQKKEKSKLRHELFLEIWKEREKFYDKPKGRGYVECFESGVRLDTEHFMNNTSCYHHCLLKSKYPQYDLCKQNIVIVSPHIHELTHNNIDRTPKIKQYTQELLQLHLNNEL